LKNTKDQDKGRKTKRKDKDDSIERLSSKKDKLSLSKLEVLKGSKTQKNLPRTTRGFDESLNREEMLALAGSDFDEYDLLSNDESKYLRHIETIKKDQSSY
jgi:hypothetical protein